LRKFNGRVSLCLKQFVNATETRDHDQLADKQIAGRAISRFAVDLGRRVSKTR
jgi:hypothetical protein